MLRLMFALLLLCAVPGMGQAEWKAACDSSIVRAHQEWFRYDCGPDHDCPQNRRIKAKLARGRDTTKTTEGATITWRGGGWRPVTVNGKSPLQVLEVRIDSLEAKLARAHVVQVDSTIKVRDTAPNWTGPDGKMYHLGPTWKAKTITRYEISFEPEKQ